MKNKFDELYEQVLLESGLNRIWAKTQKHACGTITSFRKSRTYAENIRNNSKILAYLQSKGYSVTSILGTYIEDKKGPNPKHANERSFFVCNQNVEGDDGGELEKDLFKMGELYDQDSVMIIPIGGYDAYLLGTSKRPEAHPSYKEKDVVGDGIYGKVAGEYLSKIKGREFAYEEVEKPQTINGMRGQAILLKELNKELSELL